MQGLTAFFKEIFTYNHIITYAMQTLSRSSHKDFNYQLRFKCKHAAPFACK